MEVGEVGDEPGWGAQQFDDSRWERVRFPGQWEDQGFPGYDGFAWARKSCRAPVRQPGDAPYKTLHSGLRDSTRRNIRKAEKEKVEVRVENTGNAMNEFCRLNRLTRREHGLPPQPYLFFEKVRRHIISEEKGFIALAYFQGKAIAGNVYFHFGDRAIYKYGASDKAYQHLRANNLVMWEAVKWFAEQGFKSFCFGRTELENEGLRQFKAGWGAEETRVHYFRYDLRQNAFVPGKEKGKPPYATLFRATPAPILNAIGSLLYRHMRRCRTNTRRCTHVDPLAGE